MSAFYSVSKRIVLFFFSKQGRYLLGLFLFIFLFTLLVRSCSTSVPKHTNYHIGRDSSWYFLNLMGKEKNLGVFTDELLTNIAFQEKIRFILSFSKYEELLTKLEGGVFDGIISNMQPETHYSQSLVFSDPYLLLGPVLIVKVNSKLKAWEDIKYKIIGIQSQSPSLFEFTQDTSILLRLYDNILSALEDLEQSRIDGVILPAWPAFVYTNTFFPNRLRVATTPLNNDGLRLVALKNERGEALIKDFNEGLKKLKETDFYDQLIQKWGLVNPEKVEK